jgi:tripeptide aminopeptidase
MENAIKIAARIIDNLPKDTCSPETTAGKDGFVHPISVEAELDRATLKFILRDFSTSGLKDKAAVLKTAVKRALADFPRSTYTLKVTEQYRNMKEVLDQHPTIVDTAMEAVRRAGLTPKKASIRGGTDGSRLSFMGLPCPNIFAGEHAFHSRLEWVSVQDMQAAVRTIVHLAMLWEERS